MTNSCQMHSNKMGEAWIGERLNNNDYLPIMIAR